MAFKYEITISDPNKTRYTVPAALNAASDLTVLINSVEVANYTVQGEGPGNAQFDVIFDTAPVGQVGDTITFLRATATGRISDFSSGTSWTPDAFNQEFDNLHQIIDDVTGSVDVSTIDLGVIDTRLQVEEATSADHESRISTIEGQNLDPRVTALEANDSVQDSTLANHEGRLDSLEDASYQQTGLPDKTGKALQYLRVKSDETGVEWDQASAADIANDSTAAGATVKDALDDHESRLDVAEPQIAANQAAISQEVTDRQNADNNLQSQINGKVSTSGDTMTGPLTMAGGAKQRHDTEGIFDEFVDGGSPSSAFGVRKWRGDFAQVTAWNRQQDQSSLLHGPRMRLSGATKVYDINESASTIVLSSGTATVLFSEFLRDGFNRIRGFILFNGQGGNGSAREDVTVWAYTGSGLIESKTPTTAWTADAGITFLAGHPFRASARSSSDWVVLPFDFQCDCRGQDVQVQIRAGVLNGSGLATIQNMYWEVWS
ncbi:MAG: hypothetical protein D6816_17050 [Bacteroidetes bacterium]|nr:MAG: hypothetical protein D6816_17050 [Bacteroidota bacterium]